MRLRETFDNLDATASRQGHKDDHAAIHRRLNSFVYADDYASIQAALDDCAARKLRMVLLNASKIYDITATLTIPDSVTLDGDWAAIRAAATMDVMILPGNYSAVVQCRLNGGGALAANGISLTRTGQWLINNQFSNFTDPAGAAIKAGGALYCWLERNYVLGAAGYALDARQEYSPYGNATYYGINVLTSTGNAWGGRMGVRFEGFGQFRGDNWELKLDGNCALQIGGAISTHVVVDGCYFEMTLGKATTLTGVRIMGSARASLQGCQLNGQMGCPGSAIDCATAYGVVMTGNTINRWAAGVGGLLANNAPVLIGGNFYVNTTTPINLKNLENAHVSLLETP
jgi:hypothetical protein